MSIYLNNTNERMLKMVTEWTKSRKTKSLLHKANSYSKEQNLNLEELNLMNKDLRKIKLKESFTNSHHAKFAAMPLHGQYVMELDQPYIDAHLSNNWIREGKLKPTTEATVFAIQEQAVTTNYIKKHIHKSITTDICRLCNSNKETIHHIISGCTVLAKSEYLKRHNNVAKEVYIKIAEEFKFLKKNENQWYKYEPKSVVENKEYKVLWDFPIQTDRTILHNRPDIVIIDKVGKTIQIIDIAIPSDYNIIEKRNEKIRKYINLSMELKDLWHMEKVYIIPVIIGATGTVYKGIKDEINYIPGNIKIESLQKIAVLGTAHIWRRFNEMIKH